MIEFDPPRGAGQLWTAPRRGGFSGRKPPMSAHPRLRNSGNLLLDQLPAVDFDPLESSLQRVSLTLKQVVHEFDADVAHIHFPTTALMSLMTVLEEDDPVEAATVGREGFIGMAADAGRRGEPASGDVPDGRRQHPPAGPILPGGAGRGPGIALLCIAHAAGPPDMSRTAADGPGPTRVLFRTKPSPEQGGVRHGTRSSVAESGRAGLPTFPTPPRRRPQRPPMSGNSSSGN